jgi:hypothetical protein
LGGLFTHLQQSANLAGGLPFKVTGENHHPVCFGQFVKGDVQEWSDLLPVRVRFRWQALHGIGFLFARSTAHFTTHQFGGLIGGGAMEPTGETGTSSQMACLSGEDGERGLSHVLRQMRIHDDTQSHGIDQGDVAADKFRKGRFATFLGVVAEQLVISWFVHLPDVTRRRPKRTA